MPHAIASMRRRLVSCTVDAGSWSNFSPAAYCASLRVVLSMVCPFCNVARAPPPPPWPVGRKGGHGGVGLMPPITSSKHRLPHQRMHELPVVIANRTRCVGHENGDELLFRIDPEV